MGNQQSQVSQYLAEKSAFSGNNRGLPPDLEFAAYGKWSYLGNQYDNKQLSQLRDQLVAAQKETVESIAKTDRGLLGWVPFVGNKIGEKYLGDDFIKKIESRIDEDPFAAYLAGQDNGLFDRDVSWVDFAKGKSAVNPAFNNPVTDLFSETGKVAGNLQETGLNLAQNVSELANDLTKPGNFQFTLVAAAVVAALILFRR